MSGKSRASACDARVASEPFDVGGVEPLFHVRQLPAGARSDGIRVAVARISDA